MKKILYLLMGLFLVSCSGPEIVAKKALKEIGNGMYRKGPNGEYNLDKASDDNLYTTALLYTSYAEDFSKKGVCSPIPDFRVLKDAFFQTDVLFDKVKLLDKIECPAKDIYTLFTSSAVGDYELYVERVEFLRQEKAGFRANENMCAYLEYSSVPIYCLRYKADNKYIITVYVLKLPWNKYRVGLVTIN